MKPHPTFDPVTSAQVQWLACLVLAKREPTEKNKSALKRAECRYLDVWRKFGRKCYAWDEPKHRYRYKRIPKDVQFYPTPDAYAAA